MESRFPLREDAACFETAGGADAHGRIHAHHENISREYRDGGNPEFPTPEKFCTWLEEHHQRTHGFWLRIFKKDSGEKSITYAEALDEALGYGWIDGQKKSLDAASWLQKFTPRRRASGWSKVNTAHAERLILAGRMKPAGLAQVEAARADGRWSAAYDSPRNAVPPADFLAALERDPAAGSFFATLNRANVYAIVYRLQTARKPETRAKRLAAILGMLARGEKFH